MSSQPCKVFVINLKKDKDRREYIKEHFQDRNIEFEFVEGIPGQNINQRLVDFDKAEINQRRRVSLNEMGCSLSHQKIYKKIIEDNLEGAFIFEDDVVLLLNAKKILSSINTNKNKLPKGVWLGMSKSYFYINKHIVTLFNNGNDVSVFESYRTNGALGYYIDRLAAERLIAINTPVSYLADSVVGYRDKLVSCCISQVVCLENSSLGSSIGGEYRNYKKHKPLYKKIVRLIRNNVGVIFDNYLRPIILKQRKSTKPKELSKLR